MFLGALPNPPELPTGRELLGLYGGPAGQENNLYRSMIHGTVYPNNCLGEKLREAAMLMKRTDIRVIGMRLGGWDTHERQGQLAGTHTSLLGTIAQGFQAIYRDLQSQWNDLIIVTMTEFGRTSKENGSQGTDHAESSVMFVAGGSVQGGIYNCDETTWKNGDMFSECGRYLARQTDFRAVFAEIFQRHFGDAPQAMNAILPGYSAAQSTNPAGFDFLNFISV